MTMSVAWSIGGKTFVELGITILRDSQVPILPGTRDQTLTIPGRHGTYDFGAELESRLIELECLIKAQNQTELQQLIRDLAIHLIDTTGKPKILELRLSDPDKFYLVRYSGSLPVERLAGLGRFTLPLVAFDPFAYGPEQVFETTITQLPFTFEIQSNGDIRTPPVIVLTNVGTNTIQELRIVNEYLLEG